MYNLYQINHIKFKNIYHENLHIILGITQIARGTATVVQCEYVRRLELRL